jgi:hypothetical protein
MAGGSGSQMMQINQAPVRDTPLNEIGFAEFTAKLITDVFNALVSANMTQTQAYIQLVQSVSKDLTSFINDTKDEIGGAQILDLLTRLLPDPAAGTSKVVKGGTLQVADAKALGESLTIANYGDTGHSSLVHSLTTAAAPVKLADPADGSAAGSGAPSYFDAILDATAHRIAADKYSLLKEMVKMGLLRLVVEHGVIETRLSYNTYTSSFHASEASSYDRTASTLSGKLGGGLMSFLLGAPSLSETTNTLKVSTARSTDRDISGSAVQVFGRVQIDFKTDYQPLNT